MDTVLPSNYIKPLFLYAESATDMSHWILSIEKDDDYNKGLTAALIDAKNDAEAITSFLNEYKDSKETLRSYSKEIERLLLWCIHLGRVNISSLRRDHLVDYCDFMKDPQPFDQWCGPQVGRQLKQGGYNPKWRPFVSGLSDNTVDRALTIIDSFFNYLVKSNYLSGNPLAVDRRRRQRHQIAPEIVDRYLEIDEIQEVLIALEEQPAKTSVQRFNLLRARYIILLLFYTGMRISEAAEHCMSHFTQREGNWFLRVVGKGQKQRDIPVPDELLDVLAEFRLAVGLTSPQPEFNEATPLIPMKNLVRPISNRRIDQILRWAFECGACRFGDKHPHKASKLRRASAHWLRHSYVTSLLDTGAPLKVAQENAGHSDVSTTMHYRHVAQTDRHKATRDLSLTEQDDDEER